MIDIDFFKQINDTYGHDKGDLVLQEVAAILRHHFRRSDPIFRIGGEEFLIIFETSDTRRILQLLERVRQKIAAHTFDEIDRRITISIGVAKYKEGDDVQSLYRRADRALYEAKARGRDTMVYEGEDDGG